jgi:small subunit ribosomal protein S16
MPVKIRLTRRGRKKLALYDIIVADSRSPRDGKFIEKLGTFNPTVNPAKVELNVEKAFEWVLNGAQPTDTVRTLLSQKGVMLKKHLQIGVNKGAITQEAADTRFAAWQNQKEGAVTSQATELASGKEKARQERLAAEAKVNIARQEALNAKNAAALAAAQPQETTAETETAELPSDAPADEVKPE